MPLPPIMNQATALPPGQFEIADFPRFGLLAFAERFATPGRPAGIDLDGALRSAVSTGNRLDALERIEQVSAMHCVTGWTRRSLHWSGVRFAHFYEQLVQPLIVPDLQVNFVVVRGQDGYRSILPLADLLGPDVMLADRLDGQPLSPEHGAPLRLVAPQHYGYKSVKHISGMTFLNSSVGFRPVGWRFMAHPRARVEQEERGLLLPAWLLRTLYRPLVTPVSRRFARAMARHVARQEGAQQG